MRPARSSSLPRCCRMLRTGSQTARAHGISWMVGWRCLGRSERLAQVLSDDVTVSVIRAHRTTRSSEQQNATVSATGTTNDRSQLIAEPIMKPPFLVIRPGQAFWVETGPPQDA